MGTRTATKQEWKRAWRLARIVYGFTKDSVTDNSAEIVRVFHDTTEWLAFLRRQQRGGPDWLDIPVKNRLFINKL